MDRKLFIILFFLLLTSLSLFGSCGGNSKGELVIFGTLNQENTILSFNTRNSSPVSGALVEALGDSSTTDQSGQFFLYGNKNNIPSETLVGITFPTRNITTEFVAVDTSGEAPINVNITKNSDGSYTFVLLGGSSDLEIGITTPETSTSEDTNDDSTSTETNSDGTTCDLVLGANELNPQCTEDKPFCLNSTCVECLSDADCGLNQFCLNNVCTEIERPTSCDETNKICDNGSSVTCLSNCMCDDGYPIGNCSSTCMDTGAPPTQCSDTGYGCIDGSLPVCPF